jgi:voltage-gated potassium channel
MKNPGRAVNMEDDDAPSTDEDALDRAPSSEETGRASADDEAGTLSSNAGKPDVNPPGIVESIRMRLRQIMDGNRPGDKAGNIFSIFITGLIFLNVIAVILETEKSLSASYEAYFNAFETFSIVVFTIEYMLRLWTCTLDSRYAGAVKGRMRYVLTPLAIVDLLSVLPFYIPMILPMDLRFLRALRLMRVFSIFKLGRYNSALRTIGNVLRREKEELLITLYAVIIFLVISSSVVYFFEDGARNPSFRSIPAALWWGVVTLTTVGYGDVYPVTPVGKFLASIIALMGIGVFALPAGILASGFAEELKSKADRCSLICPHCGKEIDGQSAGKIKKGFVR